MDSVILAVLGIELLAGLAAFFALIHARRPFFAVPAGIAGILALIILLLGPRVASSSGQVDIVNLGAARFKDYYEQNPVLYGEPVAPATVKGGVITQLHVYARQEYHEEIALTEWKYQLGNIVEDYMQYKGIKSDASPVMPKVIAAYLADHASKGVDVFRAYGQQLTNPRLEDGTVQVFFQKSIFSYLTNQYDSSEDPAAVKRLPVGRLLWAIEQGRSLDERWTTPRIQLLVAAGICLVVALMPVFVRRLRESNEVPGF